MNYFVGVNQYGGGVKLSPNQALRILLPVQQGNGGKVLATDGSQLYWTPGGSGLTGSGTANEIAYFTAPTVLSSLSTATYPSLTELSYVKGVTSSIQTQITNLSRWRLVASWDGATVVTLVNAATLYNLQSVLIPANTFQNGDRVSIIVIAGKNQSGASQRTLQLNFDTSISTGGTKFATFASTSSGSRYLVPIERNCRITATGIVALHPDSSTAHDISQALLAAALNIFLETTVDFGVDQYLNALGLSASIGTRMEIYSIQVWRYR